METTLRVQPDADVQSRTAPATTTETCIDGPWNRGARRERVHTDVAGVAQRSLASMACTAHLSAGDVVGAGRRISAGAAGRVRDGNAVECRVISYMAFTL